MIKTSSRLIRLARAGSAGSGFYNQAENELRVVCNLEGWPLWQFVATLAITSPRVAIRRNVRIALQYAGSGSWFPNVMGSIRQSQANFDNGKGFGGQKVSAFYRALLGDNQAIVLDIWIARALKIEQEQYRKKATRARACELIRQAARATKQSPRDCQAAIWAGTIAEHNRNPGLFPILSEYRNWLAYNRAYPQRGAIPQLCN